MFGKPKISIKPLSVEEEYNLILYNLSKSDWFSRNNYDLVLPKSKEFHEYLKQNPKRSDNNYKNLLEIFRKEYDAIKSKNFISNLNRHMNTFNTCLTIFSIYKKKWSFYLPNQYNIFVSQYGTAGSYDVDKANIIIRINNDPKSYQIIIHEMVHIGIEHLVHKYNINHEDKERIVDTICHDFLNLKHKANHKRGSEALKHLIIEDKLNNLPHVLERFFKIK